SHGCRRPELADPRQRAAAGLRGGRRGRPRARWPRPRPAHGRRGGDAHAGAAGCRRAVAPRGPCAPRGTPRPRGSGHAPRRARRLARAQRGAAARPRRRDRRAAARLAADAGGARDRPAAAEGLWAQGDRRAVRAQRADGAPARGRGLPQGGPGGPRGARRLVPRRPAAAVGVRLMADTARDLAALLALDPAHVEAVLLRHAGPGPSYTSYPTAPTPSAAISAGFRPAARSRSTYTSRSAARSATSAPAIA